VPTGNAIVCMDMLGVWHYLIVTMGLYYIAPCVCVCVDQIYTQDGRLIAVTSQEGVVRADAREPQRQPVSDIGMPISNSFAKL